MLTNSTSLSADIASLFLDPTTVGALAVVGILALLYVVRSLFFFRARALARQEAQDRAELAAALEAKARAARLAELLSPRAYVNPLRCKALPNGEFELAPPGRGVVREADVAALGAPRGRGEEQHWVLRQLIHGIEAESGASRAAAPPPARRESTTWGVGGGSPSSRRSSIASRGRASSGSVVEVEVGDKPPSEQRPSPRAAPSPARTDSAAMLARRHAQNATVLARRTSVVGT